MTTSSMYCFPSL
uniref:Uncharacterized protein n=1 Tax=Rhizophora mucronata TaxID=61149 RepID=A0A2P2NX09_RHIMU